MKKQIKAKLERLEERLSPKTSERALYLKGLLRKFDLKKCIIKQIEAKNSFDEVPCDFILDVISEANLKRDSKYQVLIKKPLEILTRDEDNYIYEAILFNQDKNLTAKEKDFLQCYKKIRDDKFFPNEEKAIQNYLKAINENLSLHLNIPIKTFLSECKSMIF